MLSAARRKKFDRVVSLLIERTNAGGVKWTKSAINTAFSVGFGKVTVIVDRPGRAETASLHFYDDDGDEIDASFSSRARDIGGGQERLNELYQLVRDNVLDVDAVIDEIIEALENS